MLRKHIFHDRKTVSVLETICPWCSIYVAARIMPGAASGRIAHSAPVGPRINASVSPFRVPRDCWTAAAQLRRHWQSRAPSYKRELARGRCGDDVGASDCRESSHRVRRLVPSWIQSGPVFRDHARFWLQEFVSSVGDTVAKELLEGVGNIQETEWFVEDKTKTKKMNKAKS